MSGRRARRCEVAKRAARVRLVVRLHTICPFVNVLVTYSLDYSIPPPEFALRFWQMRISNRELPDPRVDLLRRALCHGPSPECPAASSTSPKVPAPLPWTPFPNLPQDRRLPRLILEALSTPLPSQVPASRESTLAEAIRHITPQRAPKGNSRVTSEINLPRPLLDAPRAARPRRRFARRPQSARTARANSRRDNSAYHASARSERQLSRGPRLPLAVSLGQLGTIDMNVSTCIGWDSPWKPPPKR